MRARRHGCARSTASSESPGPYTKTFEVPVASIAAWRISFSVMSIISL